MSEITFELENISEILFNNSYNSWGNAIRKAIALLKEQEKQKYFVDNNGKTTPLPVVVRCKNYKWYDERISMCNNCGLPRGQTFFCADGKRR